jgi:PAS domain S-box-containing protein
MSRVPPAPEDVARLAEVAQTQVNALLYALTAALNAADTERAVILALGKHAAALMHASVASVSLLRGADLIVNRLLPSGEWLEFHYQPPSGTSVLRHAIETRQPYRADDLSADPYTDRDGDAANGFRTQLAAPLMGRAGDVLGVISLFNKHGDQPFSERDEALVTALATQAAIALERTRAQAEVASALEALRLRDRALAAASNGVVITDPQQEGSPIIYVNPAFERLTGYTAEECIGQLTGFLTGPGTDEGAVRELARALRDGRESVVTLLNYRKDGSTFWDQLSISPVRDEDGTLKQWVGVLTDVTERRHAELAQGFLAEAGAVLSATADYRTMLNAVAGVAVPTLGDSCSVFIVGPDGQAVMEAHANVDPVKIAVAEAMLRRFPIGRATGGLSHVLRRGESLLVSTVDEQDMAAVAHSPEHLDEMRALGMCSCMMVPLLARGRTLGALIFMTAESKRIYGAADLVLAEELARLAALALDRANLHEEVAQRQQELQTLVGRLLTSQEEERRRVAYELHDGLAQVLAANHQYLQSYARRYRPRSEAGRAALDAVLALAQRCIGETRRVVAGLRPTILDDFGLASAVRQELDALRHAGWTVTYEENLGDERLPVPVETALFRVVQEAVTNARKHSQTTNLRVRLHRTATAVRVEVRDPGRGFDPATVSRVSGPGERLGISSMQERVALLGGHLQIRSRPNRGTHVVVEVPVGQS